jgi:transcriptional regulator with XRE-family HTH domain
MKIDETTQKLGAAIKRKRKSLKIPMRDVQSATGVSISTIHRVESGQKCDADTMTRLADWLGVPADRFFQGGDIDTFPAVVYNPDEPLPDIIEAHLLKDENLTDKQARALSELFRTAYEQFADFKKK